MSLKGGGLGFASVSNLELDDTLGIQFSGRTSNPSDALLAAGRVYYNSTSKALVLYNGTKFSTIPSSYSHLTSKQTTKPNIAVTQQNGITAAAISAGSTDTAGVITTTGTNNNAGTTILTVTFNVAYAVAPVVVLTAANASGAGPNPPYVTSSTTGFVVTIPASATAGATPSWGYHAIEVGT